MSWADHVNTLTANGKPLPHAAIIGTDGSIWAQSAQLGLSAIQAKEIANAFANTADAQAKGIHIGPNNDKYFVLQAEPERLMGRKGASGFTARKTKQAIVFGVYTEATETSNAETKVASYADYLINSGL